MNDKKPEGKVLQFPKKKTKKVVMKEPDPKSPRLEFKFTIEDEDNGDDK